MFRRLPPHLTETPWIEFEQGIALDVMESLKPELDRLIKKPSAKRVHDARVALRRWHSIWDVLIEDGWESKQCYKDAGKDLRGLHKLLGELRDWDVNLETGATSGVPDDILLEWTGKRKKAQKVARSQLKKLKVNRVLKDLQKHIRTRPKKLKKKQDESRLAESAYEHLEQYLVIKERVTRELENRAQTAEELHQLRLSIKAWRYFLAEFFGVTNLELVRAQQVLGKLNDLQRARLLLEHDHPMDPIAKNALKALCDQQSTLMAEFDSFRKGLPYGLRPGILSI